MSVGISQKDTLMRSKVKLVSIIWSEQRETETTKGLKDIIIRHLLKKNIVRDFEL
jgi:hypothetical protein